MARQKGKKALVLGIGNILMGDDGVGVRAAEYFRDNFQFGPDIACLDGGTSGMGLLSYIREFTHLVIIDAVAKAGEPGEVITLPGEKVEGFPALKASSAHQIGVKDLLAIARFEGLAPELAVIGVIPKEISAGMELTPEAARALPKAAEAVRDELERFGFKASRMGG